MVIKNALLSKLLSDVRANSGAHLYVRINGTRGRNIRIHPMVLEDIVLYDTINQPLIVDYELHPTEIFITAININTNGTTEEEDQREAQ